MRIVIKPRIQYFMLVLPQAIVAVMFCAYINFTVNKFKKQCYKLCGISILYIVIVLMIIPVYIEEFWIMNYHDTAFSCVYTYFFNIIISVWLIRKQNDILCKEDTELS